MKKVIPLLYLGIIIGLAQPLPPAVDEPPPLERREPKELIETLRKVRLIEELKLTDEQSIKFFPKVNELKEARDAFNQQRQALIGELANLLKKGAKATGEINAEVDKLFELEESFHKKEVSLKKEMRKILTPEQQVRLILFQIRFDEEMRDMIQKVREWRERGEPKGKPGRTR